MTWLKCLAEDLEENDLIQCQLFTRSHPEIGKRKGSECKCQQKTARLLLEKDRAFVCCVHIDIISASS